MKCASVEDDKKDYHFINKNMTIRSIGNTLNLFIGNSIEPIMTIGPDYLYTALILSFILLIGGITYWFIISISPLRTIRTIWKFTYTFSLITFGFVVLKNPVVALEKATITKSDNLIECEKCNVIQDAKTQHCKWCNVCVKGFDHHCVAISKCIGKGNKIYFYLFIGFAAISLALDYGMIIHFFYIVVIK